VAAARANDARGQIRVDVEVRGGLVEIVPQTPSALRHRRRRPTMLSYFEVPGHIVALEAVRLDYGARAPRRFVVWDLGERTEAHAFRTVEEAVQRFLAALEPDWHSIWGEVIDLELAALPANLLALRTRTHGRAVRARFEADDERRPVIQCPDAAAQSRRRARRATLLTLPLPRLGGGVLVVQRVRLGRGRRGRLALFDTTLHGQRVLPFEPDLRKRIADRLEEFRQPPWRRPAPEPESAPPWSAAPMPA
jgi:hypothetical protein